VKFANSEPISWSNLAISTDASAARAATSDGMSMEGTSAISGVIARGTAFWTTCARDSIRMLPVPRPGHRGDAPRT